MKALVTRTYRQGNKIYKLRVGEPIPQMPASLKKVLEEAGYIGKKAEKAPINVQQVIIDPQEHNIEEEELFTNTVREEEK